MKNLIRVHALWLASALLLLFVPKSAEAQKALVYCPAIDQSGCTTVRAALLTAFPGGVDIADDGANGTVDLRTADLFQYAVFFVPSLAETDSAAPYARLREQVVADRLKAALLGRRAFWSGTPDQGALASTRPQKDQLIQNLAAWASADFGTVNAPGLVVLQDNSDVVTSRYSWVQPIVGFQIVADPKLASYNSVRSLTAAGNTILSSNGSTLAYGNMASFGFQTPSGASGVSLDAVGQTGTSVGGQVVLLTQMGANTGGAAIKTDTDDYPPGTPVIMTGSGFQGGETVTLTLHEDPLLHADRVHSATADENGGFVYSGFAPEDHDIDVRFILTAKGQTSGRQAQTTFTDAVNMASTPVFFSVSASACTSVSVTNGAVGTALCAQSTISANPGSSTNNFVEFLWFRQGQSSPAFKQRYPATGILPANGSATAFSVQTPDQAGTWTVKVCQSDSGCSNNPTTLASTTISVAGKTSQTTAVNVTGMPSSPQQFGTSFTVGATGGNGTGVYNFTATGVCSVGLTSGVVSMTSSAGVCSVTAIRLGDASFFDSPQSAAATVNATVAIQPAVTLTVPSTTLYPTGFTATASGGVAGATFAYSTSSLACSVNTSGVVTINSIGTCAITATAKAANYADATDTKSTTINPGTQPAVTLTLPATTTYPTGVTASAAGGATGSAFSYSTASTACSVVASSGVITINSVGACAITATATAANYADATDTKTMTIGAATTTTVVTVANATFDGSVHGGTALVTGPGGLSQSLTVSYVGRNGTTYPLNTTAPTNAGDYTASASYTAAGNYLGSSDSQDFSIGKATATITVNGFTGTYDGAAHGATGAATGIGGASLSGLDLGASFTDVPGGIATWTFTDVSGNYSSATGTAGIVITKANQTISFAALPNKTYGDAPFSVGATASSGLAVGFSVSGNCSITGSNVTITGAGSCTVTATQAGNGNYNAAVDVARSFDVAKAKATVNVTGYSAVFDGAAHGATGSATGIGGVDLSSLLSLGASFTNVPGGTASWTFAGDANYEAANGTAAITITKANATIAVEGYTGVYDGSAHGASGAAKGIGGVSLDGLNLGSSFTNVPGGTASWTFTDATGNYKDATGTAAIVITRANATVNVSGYTGVYDGNAHGATGTATGVKGESLAGLALGATFTNAPGGTASWTFSDATGNYNNTAGTAAILISKADPKVTVDGYTGTYDGNAHGASGSAKGVKGEALSGLALGASFTNVPGGTANWTFTDGTGNYNNASGTAAIVINKANPTVNVSGYTGAYDGSAHGATGTATGVTNESLAGLDLGASFTNVPGGTATWKYTDATGNYNDATGTAAIVISKVDAQITVNGYTGVYDAAPHGATGDATGVKGESLTGLAFGASFTDVPGGTATWTFTDVTGNYNSANGTAAIVITQATPTVTAAGGSFTYDNTAHPGSGSAKGVSAVDLGAVTLSYAKSGSPFAGPPINAGSYEVTAHYAGSTNYTAGSSAPAAIEIAKADANITVNGYTGVYDGNAHGATGTANGVGGVALAGLNIGASYTNVPGGTASWTFTDATGNYNSASGTASIVISKATINAPVLTDLVKPYNSAAQQPVVTTTPSGVLVALTFFQNNVSVGSPLGVSPVGVYRVEAAITDPNYAGPNGSAYFVIYDPNGGFVTGGGWINSPVGACKLSSCTDQTTGKANFGFVSKYQNGANKSVTLTGNTEFQFQAGNLNFKSTAYDWLTVSGARAQYKGSGTINGSGNYQFMLTAIDGSLPGGNNQDRFRIKITDANGGVVYDNQMSPTDDAGLTTNGTLLGGGSVNIHK
jgi:hypothetical protein